MYIYKITLSDSWKYTEHGFFTANSHAEAIKEVDTNVKRINNNRFREIETTGKFYFVEEVHKAGKCFIFETSKLTD